MPSSSIKNKSDKFFVISLLLLLVLTTITSFLDASVPSSSPLSGLLLWNISLNPPHAFSPGDPSSQHTILYVGETPISSANETKNFLFYVYYSSTSFDVPQPYSTQQPITISAVNIISGKSLPWTFLVDGDYGSLRRAPYTFKLILENNKEQYFGFFAAPPYVGAPPISSQSEENPWNLFSLDAESGDVLLNCSLPSSNIDHFSSHRIRFDFTKGILFFLTVTGVSTYNISELMAFPAPTDGVTDCPGYMRTTSFDNYGYLLYANSPTEMYVNESAQAMFLMYTSSVVEYPQNSDVCEMAGYLNGGVPWSDSTTGGMSWFPNVSDHYGLSPPLILPASYIYQSTNVGFLWYTQYASTVFVNTEFYSATMSYEFRVPANGQVFSFSFSIPGSPQTDKYPVAGWVFWSDNTKSLISSESLDSAATFYIISRALPNTMNAQTTDKVQTNWKTNAPSNCPRVYSPVDDFAYNNNILNKFFRKHPSRSNGNDIMLVTCATPEGNIGMFAIRLTDGAILYNETDESLFWTGGAMGMTQSKYLQQSQQVFSSFEESQSNFGMSVIVATRKRKESSLGETEFGQIVAFAPCFLFPENDPGCPSSCIAQYGACGPRSASKTLCESEYTKAVFGEDVEYYWCEALGTCVDRAVVPNCTCEYFDQFLCDKAPGSCFFCKEQGACVYQNQYPACKCDTFSERQCQNSQQSTSSCKYCSDLKACVESTQNQNCECSKLPEASCLANAGGSCSWCPDIQYCNWKGQSCECVSFLNSSTCLAAPNSTCKWCDDPLGVCIDLSKQNKFMQQHHFDIKPTGCSCFELSEAECVASMAAGFENPMIDNASSSSSCQWQQPVLVGVDNAQGYCTNSLSCPNPLTCEGLNFASEVEYSCIASGCTFNVNNNNENNKNQRSSGLCQSAMLCENFLLPSFVSQPYILLFAGFLKDTIILLLIGVIGDAIARRIRKYGTPFLIWWYGWPKKQINIEVDKTTVYLTDDVCRDEEQFVGMSFEEYCLDVIDEIFILSPKMNKLFFNDDAAAVDENKNNNNNYKSRQNFENNEDLISYTLSAAVIEEQRKNVFDAVAFALSDNGFWIDLDLLKEYRRIAQLEEILETERIQEREEMNEKHRQALMTKNIDEKEIITLSNSQKQNDQKNVSYDDDNQQHDYSGGGYGSITDSRRDSNCSVQTIPQTRHSKHFTKNNNNHNNNDNAMTKKVIAVLPSAAPKRPPTQEIENDIDDILCNKRPVFFKQSHIGEQQSLLNNFNQIKADDIQTKGLDRKKTYPIEKVTLGTVTLASKVLLQKVVTRSIQERVTSIVFYAHSRDLHRRVASSLNTFPSTLQLLFYTFSLVVMFFVAFWVVILDSGNRKKVEQVAAFSCGDRVGNQSTPNNNNNNGNSTYSDNLEGDSASLARATLLLLGFRVLNASSFGTFCLVFVKVIRGIYHRFFEKEGLANLTLSQRLPLIALFSNRSIHILLLIYAGMVFPFCWISPFYGWKFGPVVGLPFIFCLIGLAVDAFILKIARSIINGNVDDGNNNNQSEKDYSQHGADYLDHEEEEDEEGDGDSTRMSVAESWSSSAKRKNTKDNCKNQENSAPSLVPSRESALTGISRGSKRGNASHSASLVPRQIEHEREETRSISSATPLTIGRALIVFLLSEEIPTILLTVSLQVGFNYVCFLEYQDSFGVTTATVAKRDFDSRKIQCVYQIMRQDISGFFAGMSSLVAFW